jgi:hypothetical protein
MPQMAAAHDDHQPLPFSYQPTDGCVPAAGSRGQVSTHLATRTLHFLAPNNKNNPDLSCHILTSSPSFPNPVSSLFFLGYHVRWHICGVCLVMIYLSLNPLFLPTMLSRILRCILVRVHPDLLSTFNGPSCRIRFALSTATLLVVASRCLYP